MTTASYQSAVQAFVSKEVVCNINSMITAMLENAETSDYEEELRRLAYATDYQEAAEDEGWREYASGFWIPNEDLYLLEADDTHWRVYEITDPDTLGECVAEIEIPLDEDGDELGVPPDIDELPTDLTDQIPMPYTLIEDLDDIDGHTEVDTDASTWEDLCSDHSIEPYEHEIYEHYAVSDWLGRKLSQHGESVEGIHNLTVWGRATTGQAIMLDGVINEIYRETHPEEFDAEGNWLGEVNRAAKELRALFYELDREHFQKLAGTQELEALKAALKATMAICDYVE